MTKQYNNKRQANHERIRCSARGRSLSGRTEHHRFSIRPTSKPDFRLQTAADSAENSRGSAEVAATKNFLRGALAIPYTITLIPQFRRGAGAPGTLLNSATPGHWEDHAIQDAAERSGHDPELLKLVNLAHRGRRYCLKLCTGREAGVDAVWSASMGSSAGSIMITSTETQEFGTSQQPWSMHQYGRSDSGSRNGDRRYAGETMACKNQVPRRESSQRS